MEQKAKLKIGHHFTELQSCSLTWCAFVADWQTPPKVDGDVFLAYPFMYRYCSDYDVLFSSKCYGPKFFLVAA